jgi:hypothetical protein
VIGTQRWRENWAVLAPPGAVRVDLARARVRQRALREDVAELATGTTVVLCAGGLGASRRCKVFADATNLELESEYLAFPSATAPAYLVEDDQASIRFFAKEILVAPPRLAPRVLIDAGLSLLRAGGAWRLLRRLAPGRVAVGKRR